MPTFMTNDGVTLTYEDTGGAGTPPVMLHDGVRRRRCSPTSSPDSVFSGDTDPDVGAFVAEQITATPAHAGVPLLFDHCAQDWRDVLPRIDVPTLVLGCDGSHVSPESQRYIADRVPDARLHVFPTTQASSHFVFLENPAAFDAVVDAFLKEPDRHDG